jgi:hypothetical protein
MANHVSFNVWFREINDAAKARWKEMCENLNNDQQDGYEYWMGDLWVDGKEGSPTLDEVRQYDWTCDVIGPKWAYINDFDEDSFQGYSAWSAPEEGVTKILEELAKFDPNMITSMTYDDEMPNFVGWSVWLGDQLEDGCEDEYEEIREAVFMANPDIQEQWDYDADEWKCDEDGDMTDEAYEAEDAFRDVMYDQINDMQEEGIEEAIKAIKNYQEENE